MISLDQVILLEKKVESAVAKIQQLKAENDALRSKCSELTNALSAKSEQLSSFENDQSQIENGIKKALDRLNSIENSVLKATASVEQDGIKSNPINQQATFQDLKPVAQKTIQRNIPSMYFEDSEPEVSDTSTSMEFSDSSELDTPTIPDPADDIFDQSFNAPIPEMNLEAETDSDFNMNNDVFSETSPDIYQQDDIPEDFDNNSSDISDEQTDLGFDIF